jgi:hypothetical protein
MGQGNGTAAEVVAPAASPSIASAAMGRGVKILLRGTGGQAAEQLEVEEVTETVQGQGSAAAVRTLVPTWVLWATDLLCVLLAIGLVWKRAGPFGGTEILLCLLLVGVGLALALQALDQTLRESQQPLQVPRERWTLTRNSALAGARCLVIHLQRPTAVFEVQANTGAEPSVKLLWLDDRAQLSEQGLERLTAEARENYRRQSR